MNHNDIRHKLSDYTDGAIAPAEKSAIELHLKTCTECSDALRELRKTIEHIHAVEEVEAPAWMTQKIMAKVRAEQEAKTGIWQRVFAPVFAKFPVQAVAVLFLSVTVFYIYTTMYRSDKYTEAPMERFAKQEARDQSLAAPKQKTPEIAERREKKVAQKPDYKSLDMKYEYEKPAAPAREEEPARSAASVPPPAAGKSEQQPAPEPAKPKASIAKDEADLGKGAAPMIAKEEAAPPAKSAAKKPAASSKMMEQAPQTAGAARHPVAREALSRENRIVHDSPSADKEAEARRAVTDHFMKFDLPEKQKVKGLSVIVRIFQTNDTDLQWMQKTVAYQSKPCVSKYVVDVDLSGSLFKYLYCYDRLRVELLGVFAFKNGTWSEIK